MPTPAQNTQIRNASLGFVTSRATNTLPQTATGNIFVVSGGRILVAAVVGEVTTVLGGTVTTLSIGSTPTVGSAANTLLGTATAVTSLAVGGKIYSASSGGVVVDTAGAGGVQQAARILVPVGNITITTSANDTGSVKWDLLWAALDPGASVVAA